MGSLPSAWDGWGGASFPCSAGCRRGVIFVATVEYFAEGALYREPWIPAPWREELQEGKSIHLLYDPRRPCRFVLAGDNALLRRGLSGLFLALCYLLIAFGYNRLL